MSSHTASGVPFDCPQERRGSRSGQRHLQNVYSALRRFVTVVQMGAVLFSWIGTADFDAAAGKKDAGLGPLAQALVSRQFDQAILLVDYPPEKTRPYLTWLKPQTSSKLELRRVSLSSPTNYEDIYRAATTEIARTLESAGRAKPTLTFHLSPGTNAMAAIWIIIAKTRYAAELIASSKQHGVAPAHVPFELSAEFIPAAVRGADDHLARLESGLRPIAPEFSDILHRSDQMKRLLHRAETCAGHDAPVLVQGESGTGKEMLARAIHRASPRGIKPLVVVNCGAIPSELVESEFFGHLKGAFSGAIRDREGHFETAHEGTIFLDEIGELPLPAQVKLLRVLQEGKVVRVGDSRERRVDVRVIAATNRDLATEVAKGHFREDLFYRLAVLVLSTPPLRDRAGDIGELVDATLDKLNEAEGRSGRPQKKLSAKGRNLLLKNTWPGNVRELNATVLRAFVWSRSSTLDERDIAEAFLQRPEKRASAVLDHPLGDGFRLDDSVAEVARHYIARAREEAHGNLTKAAKLVGFSSYQRLKGWAKKYGVEL
jgi:DNA-binding NtrC family response regulator